MTKAPDWSIEEFSFLLSHNDLTSSELAKLLPRRAVGAIEVVRAGIHSFHLGGDMSMLSEMMRQRLEKRQLLACPICNALL